MCLRVCARVWVRVCVRVPVRVCDMGKAVGPSKVWTGMPGPAESPKTVWAYADLSGYAASMLFSPSCLRWQRAYMSFIYRLYIVYISFIYRLYMVFSPSCLRGRGVTLDVAARLVQNERRGRQRRTKRTKMMRG